MFLLHKLQFLEEFRQRRSPRSSAALQVGSLLPPPPFAFGWEDALEPAAVNCCEVFVKDLKYRSKVSTCRLFVTRVICVTLITHINLPVCSSKRAPGLATRATPGRTKGSSLLLFYHTKTGWFSFQSFEEEVKLQQSALSHVIPKSIFALRSQTIYSVSEGFFIIIPNNRQ